MVLLSWRQRRKYMYLSAVGVLLVVALVFIWGTFFTTQPTCFDNQRNGNELEVDCGGSCALVCQITAREPVVLWARAFKNREDSYTAAAYIQNNNRGAGAKEVGYMFRLFDADNSLIVERRGTTDIPPLQVVPIIESNILVGNRSVVRTQLIFTSVPVWMLVPSEKVYPLTLTKQTLSPEESRLSAFVNNDTVSDAKRVTVAAILFDAEGVARAASKSFIENISRKSSQQVVFTWPEDAALLGADITRGEITILQSF